MFSAPFDMEKALLKACLTGDRVLLAELTGEGIAIVLDGRGLSVDEAVRAVGDSTVIGFTIDLLKVEYDAEGRRSIGYETKIFTRLQDGGRASKAYQVATRWRLDGEGYHAESVEIRSKA